jgi:hypothetical protein
MAVRNRVRGPTQCGLTVGTTRCTKGGCKQIIGRRMLGAGLSRRCVRKTPLESQLSSRTGENPPYGMIGGIEETSASFEARYAPRSYPTPISGPSTPDSSKGQLLPRISHLDFGRTCNRKDCLHVFGQRLTKGDGVRRKSPPPVPLNCNSLPNWLAAMR